MITRRPLTTGTVISYEAVALVEQIEDGEADHNILATVPGEIPEIGSSVVEPFQNFISHVFEHIPGKQMTTGRLLSNGSRPGAYPGVFPEELRIGEPTFQKAD